ncbi:M23 family metallopeptidase [Microbacterium sp. MYb62]|uniref:M23 family metallopeptidase n=1 Tax=Microbacterium sp. MYb62 TaxID=1848690 RepID=UPI0011B0B09B|nr:M23 family metallopeptidase [Microbacterium sp. MYb62]
MYVRPCGYAPISDTWQGHRNRNSAEPGTDYSVPRGMPVWAATSGIIVDRKDTPSTATGRYLALRADDGNYIRYLHLDASTVQVGTRVVQGALIAYSGASGFDSETGYGAHVHVSLWIGGSPTQLGFKNTVDFENYVIDTTPTQPANPEDPVPTHQSTTHAWNTVIPANSWIPVRVGANENYLAVLGAGRRETGEAVVNLRASGVASALQIRVVAETLNSAGAVVQTLAQPAVEIPKTVSSDGITLAQYVMPYALVGPVRMYAHVRSIGGTARIEEVTVKKNYWPS